MTPTFEWITTEQGLAGLKDSWNLLEAGDDAAPGAVFRSWEWQSTWWRVLGADAKRRRALRLLVVRDGTVGPVRAICPLYVEDAPVAGVVPRRRAAFLADGTVGSDYLGLVAGAEARRELAGVVAHRLATDATLADVDVMELHDLLDGDPLRDALPESLGRAGYTPVETEARYNCPYAQLQGVEHAAYLKARPNGFGGQLKTRRKALEKMKGFDLTVAESPADVLAGLETLFSLHRARWAAEGGSEAFTNGKVEEFHRAAAPLLADRGWARLAVLSVEGAPVAAGYGFRRGKRFDYYQAGMLPEWRRKSAGLVVLGELIERAFADGMHEFDFLRGDEPYKAIWADAVRTTSVIRALPPTRSARFAAAAQKSFVALRTVVVGAVRQHLPASTAKALRSLAWRARSGRGAAHIWGPIWRGKVQGV